MSELIYTIDLAAQNRFNEMIRLDEEARRRYQTWNDRNGTLYPDLHTARTDADRIESGFGYSPCRHDNSYG